MKNISINRAIMVGKYMLFPMVLFPIALALGIIYFGVKQHWSIYISLPASLVIPIGTVIFYWPHAITQWQIWAFTNVADVHELKKAAITEKLISDRYSLEKISKRNPDSFQTIQNRFEEPYLFTDDALVPDETAIYFRKLHQSVYSLIFLALIAGGIVLFTLKSYVPGALLLSASIGLMIWKYKSTSSTEPQLVLNSKGIQTTNELTSWEDVTNDTVYFINQGKRQVYYLAYDHSGGQTKFCLDNIYISSARLNHLLYIYRRRNQYSH